MLTALRIILLLFITAAAASAQFEHFYENWRWAHFTTKTGLPSNTIDDVIEAEDGIMWVSTSKGLAWYDGFRWNRIIIDSSLGDRRATKIVKGIKENILVVMNELLYVGNKNGFHHVKSPFATINRVNSVCVLDSSSIIITTFKDSLHFIIYYWDGSVKVIPGQLPGNIRQTNSQRIWFGNAYGLFEFTKNKFKRIIPHGFIRSISENVNNFGIMSVDSPKDQIGIWEWSDHNVPMLSETERLLPVRALDISSKNDAIAAYETGDIRIRSGGVWRALKPVPSQMVGLLCLRYTNDDNLWVGTENGLYYFRDSVKKWSWWKYEFSDPRNIVMEILETSKGDIWIGNKNGVEVRSKDGLIKSIEKINETELGLITGIAEDNNNNIWISSGASFDGAFRWDGKNWKHYGFSEGLMSPRVHKIRKDKEGHLWFLGFALSGTSLDSLKNDPGAFQYDGSSFTNISTTNGLLHNRVYSFLETNNGNLWFGTKTGLSRKSNSEWRHWGKEELHNISSIYSISGDKESNVWFSTFGSTLGYIDTKDSVHWVWDWVTDADYKQKVWDIKIDSEGIVWVATTRGLFSNNNGVWSTYDIESEFGLKELRVVLPLKNKVYVGGHGIGVGVLSREKIKIPIQAIINRPVIEPNMVLINWSVDARWCEMPSDDIEVRIKLDDDNWSEWNKSREIRLFELIEGDHTFNLQTKDMYGNIMDGYYTSKFSVPSPFYKNPFFYLPIATLLIIIIILVIQNIRSVIKNNKMVQNQRTRIANDLHDEVGSNLGSIALISQRLGRDTSISEKSKEDLSIITETSLQTSEFLRDIVWYINPRYDSFMNLEARLREIAGKMLRDIAVQIEMGENVRHDEEFIESRRNIILMFKEILHNIMKHARATSVQIRFEQKPKSFVLMVKDDGVGFGPDDREAGNGLLSLRRRAGEIGAELMIHSVKGEGTEVTIIFKNNVNTI